MNTIYDVLTDLKIEFEKIEHPAVFTVEEADKYHINSNAVTSKNLFLRNKKGDKLYLFVLESSKTADLKKLADFLQIGRLSFASPERLMKYLQLTPGSVSPFGLINDKKNEVTVIIDTDLLQGDKVAFHPNINTATLVISRDDFLKFLNWTQNEVRFFT